MENPGDRSPTAHDINEAERMLRARHYADVLRERPELVQAATTRIAMVVETSEATLGQRLWHALLGEPLDMIIRCMTADDADGRLLRSNNPFSVLIGQTDVAARRQTRRDARKQCQ
jgi:hypothetical protein